MEVPLDEIRKLTADEVLAMVDAGVLDEDERLELWDGVLIHMPPESCDEVEAIAHIIRDIVLTYEYDATVYPRCTMRSRGPFELRDPDVSVVLQREPRGGPRAWETALVVEVADARPDRDRAKLPLYASEGVGEVWLVDVPRRVVEVHRGPQPGGRYAEHTLVGPDAELPLPGTDRTIPAAVCFPRERG